MSASSASPSGEVAAGQREPQPRQRLADLEAGRAAQRPGELDAPCGPSPSPPRALVAAAGELVGRPARQVDAVGRVGSTVATRLPYIDSARNGRIGASIRASADERLVERREGRVAVGARRSLRENRRRDRRRYQVDRSSMIRRDQRAGRADGVVVGAGGASTVAASAGRARQDPAIEDRPLADRRRRLAPGVQPASRA